MAILKNTSISGSSSLTLQSDSVGEREEPQYVVTSFTSAGTTTWTCPSGVNSVEILVVGGGGGGGGEVGGGGGAGGLVYRSNWIVNPGTIYAVEVGSGGAGGTYSVTNGANGHGQNGSNSIFGTRINLISNPQFTTGITGWTSYNATLAHFNGNSLRATATAGNPSGATTTFTTVVGRRYYYKAEVSQSGAIANDARIQISGIGLLTPTGKSSVSATTVIFDSFTATSTSHILELLLYNSQVGATITIDNVEVYDITDANIVAYGGGGGTAYRGASGNAPGQAGGSGGGGGCSDPGGLGNTGGAGSSNQGSIGGAGGYSITYVSGGGGGAGGPGGDAGGNYGGGGGLGLPFSITGSTVWYAGGGGGSYQGTGAEGAGGIGGGGKGGNISAPGGTNGTANTGGGGGGAYDNISAAAVGGAGGSGIVVLRYALSLQSGTSLNGRIRTSADHPEIEVYEGVQRNGGWTSADQSINFAGHNLLAYSENFTTGTYSLVAATLISGQTAPDGTATAYRLQETNTTSSHGILVINTMITNAQYTFSIYAKAAERSWLAMRADNQTNWNWFNLSSGTIGTTNTINNTRVRIKSVGNGWYRCSITYQATGTGNDPELYIAPSDNTFNYTGSTSNGLLIWGAQLELHESAPGTYSKTDSAAAPTPYESSGYRIHRYTNTGTCFFTPSLTGMVEVLVVGGGGGAGTDVGGGGGGGGVIYNAAVPVEHGKTYKIVVGAGGAAGGGPVSGTGANGGNSQFGSLVAIGGGGGGYYYARMGYNGGSGGGQGGTGPNNIPLVPGTYFPGEGTLGQGHRGGIYRAGAIGGGGGGGAGGPGYDQWGYGADGGPGVAYDISGTLTYYAGGGGAGDSGGTNQIGYGGIGGGGTGDSRNLNSPDLQINGQPNTGGGGGADGGFTQSGSGGSGIVIVRYRSNK